MKKLLSIIFLLTIIFSGCSSVSKPARNFLKQKEMFEYLPGGAISYINIDIKNSRPLLDLAIERAKLGAQNTKYAAMFLDKTAGIVAGVYPKRKEGTLMGVAKGSAYPAGIVNMSIGKQKSWVKVEAEHKLNYWKYAPPVVKGRRMNESLKNASFSLYNSKAFFSNGNPLYFGEGAKEPLPFKEFKNSKALSAWFPNADLIQNVLKDMDIPVNLPIVYFFASISQAEKSSDKAEQSSDTWEITFYFETSSPSQAKAFAALLRIARGEIKNMRIKDPLANKLINLMFALPPLTENFKVILKSPKISSSELILLITQISNMIKI
ncbi:MAG: hypothetical protein Ta2G_19470 [Termitinemataceae bacterium]|nr:MAG: hypothetical protein Ta2G_19470 [Termitinemataceae bacterium]